MRDYAHSFAFLIVKRFSYSLSSYFLEFIWEQFHDGHRKIEKSRDLQCITSGLVFKVNSQSGDEFCIFFDKNTKINFAENFAMSFSRHLKTIAKLWSCEKYFKNIFKII